MKVINLAAPWSHHTVPVTTDYQAGSHEVADEVYDAAVAAGVHVEEGDGHWHSTHSPARAARKAQG